MLLWCCLRRWDIIPNVYALNLPSANWSYLTFRQSIDCSFPASSSADKKKASEQTVLEIQGHAELGTKVFLSEEKHKSGQFYKRLWLEKENIEHLKSLFWLPANVRQRLYVRGKTWQWIILQTFGEIDFVLLAVFPFAIFEVLFLEAQDLKLRFLNVAFCSTTSVEVCIRLERRFRKSVWMWMVNVCRCFWEQKNCSAMVWWPFRRKDLFQSS